MSIYNVFREVAIKNAPKQAVMVDALTEEAPIYAGVPTAASSHDFTNVYEQINAVDGAVVTDVDGALSTVNVASELKQTDLKSIAGVIEVGEDKAAAFGGAPAYFAHKMPAILRRTGANVEYDMIYNILRKAAIDNGKLISAGGSGSANYTILCVKWTPGEIYGYYSQKMFGDGKVFDMTPLSGGSIYKDASGRAVYGMRMKTYFGVQVANPKNISAIVNIDIANATPKTPSEAQINDLIQEARGNPANTMLYMHPKVYSHVMKSYKATGVQYTNNDQNIAIGYNAFDGIKIVTSYNFINGTEATVSV